MNNNPTGPGLHEPGPSQKKKKGKTREYIEAILTAVFIALVIRAFGIEAFKIPSSSMVSTLLIGDHIFVNKFIYGFRIPLTKIRFLEFSRPERGDVVIFMYPEDEGKDFVKRVVGLPGDIVIVEGTKVYINGEEVPRNIIEITESDSKYELKVMGSRYFGEIPYFPQWRQFAFYEERLGENDFIAQYEDDIYHRGGTYNVPDDSIFVMGDNRDNSADSREWGFVPLENVKGKAMFVWLSLDRENRRIRFDRIGKWIK